MALETIILALVLLLVPVFSKYGKVVVNKGISLIAGAGISLLLAEGFGVFWTVVYADVGIYGALLFQFIAWVLLLVGAILAILNLAKSVA